jgi:hypothetical protein
MKIGGGNTAGSHLRPLHQHLAPSTLRSLPLVYGIMGVACSRYLSLYLFFTN